MNIYNDEFGNALKRAGLEQRMIRAIINRPDLADAMVQALKIKLGTKFVDKPFKWASASVQLANVRRANKARGLGLREEDFKKLGPAPVISSIGNRHNLVALVLEVTLADAEGKADIDRTVDELWLLAAARQKKSYRYEEIASPMDGTVTRYDAELKQKYHYDPIGGGRYYDLPAGNKRRVRLAEGIMMPKPGLRWRKVDLGANWRKDDEREVDERTLRNAKSPHVAILAAAWHHPEWVRAMEMEVIPWVRIPGLEGYDKNHGVWYSMPSLAWELKKDSNMLSFNADNGSRKSRLYAVPEFVEE